MLQLSKFTPNPSSVSISDSYELCRQITAKYAKTFYLGTLLLPQSKRKAIWAVYAWCRRTDELVDGVEANLTTPETLDRWEQQLQSVFQGKPIEDTDVALVDASTSFPLKISPFQDMIAGQRMDLAQNRYQTFEELKLYCYRVAGTVGLMSSAVLGVKSNFATTPWQKKPYNPTKEAVALGIAMQLTNILRDVGEDASRGRIYLPLQELEEFDYTEQDLLDGVVDERWRALMQFQIRRARAYYIEAAKGIRYLIPDSRWPVWTALMLYQGILDVIEQNDYDVFTQRAFVSKPRKILSLPVAWLRAQAL